MRSIILCVLIAAVFIGPNVARGSDSLSVNDATSSAEVANNFSYMIEGILSYSRWPDGITPSKACVVGSGTYKGLLFNNEAISHEWGYYDDVGSLSPDRCDILYIGVIDRESYTLLLSKFIGLPVLTISENDPECDAGSLICLNMDESRIRFRVNLDAVARSGIRIHPQVLKLGRELEAAR
ncbi:YfiR family protein [Marinobacterium marinum]|uniref:YfiR family protein n=1 Tax=Marinobacterium marinum TaxID=2756129 RepID=A0A7W1WYE8_9GAMM|nr:YfiR family protein [Marinobacterium marinum]MBA4502414.1 YfiR family protein [Marinobacterium marinum]